MKHIDNLLYALGQMSEYGKEYLQNEKEIIILRVSEFAARMISKIVSRLVMVFFFLFLLLFASLTLSFILAKVLGSYIWGFGAVTLLYLLLIILVVVFRRMLITNPILKLILNDFLESNR